MFYAGGAKQENADFEAKIRGVLKSDSGEKLYAFEIICTTWGVHS